jgi:ABC-type nitrate/sulfonate/bicarbonate transport system substrate-binding protein
LGLGPKDLTFVQAGPDALRIAALQSGAAVAAALAPPALFAATGRGLTILADLGALGVKYPTSVIAARRAYVAQDRPAAKKFLMAMIEGLHIYRQKKDYAVKVLEKYTKQSDPQILSQTYDYFAKNTPLVPLSDAAVIEAALPPERPAGRSAKDFFDNSILVELEQEGFAKKLGK